MTDPNYKALNRMLGEAKTILGYDRAADQRDLSCSVQGGLLPGSETLVAPGTTVQFYAGKEPLGPEMEMVASAELAELRRRSAAYDAMLRGVAVEHIPGRQSLNLVVEASVEIVGLCQEQPARVRQLAED